MLEVLNVVSREEPSKELRVEKDFDLYPESPREYLDTKTKFYTFCRSSCSPDRHGFSSAAEWADSNGFDLGSCPDDLVGSIRKKGYIVLPVWKYEHSGVCFKAEESNPFNDPWDSGLAGVIYISREDARQTLGVKKLSAGAVEKMEEIMRSEVDMWSAYADGEVYEYILLDSDDNVIDSIQEVYGDCDIKDILDQFGMVEAAMA